MKIETIDDISNLYYHRHRDFMRSFQKAYARVHRTNNPPKSIMSSLANNECSEHDRIGYFKLLLNNKDVIVLSQDDELSKKKPDLIISSGKNIAFNLELRLSIKSKLNKTKNWIDYLFAKEFVNSNKNDIRIYDNKSTEIDNLFHPKNIEVFDKISRDVNELFGSIFVTEPPTCEFDPTYGNANISGYPDFKGYIDSVNSSIRQEFGEIVGYIHSQILQHYEIHISRFVNAKENEANVKKQEIKDTHCFRVGNLIKLLSQFDPNDRVCISNGNGDGCESCGYGETATEMPLEKIYHLGNRVVMNFFNFDKFSGKDETNYHRFANDDSHDNFVKSQEDDNDGLLIEKE